MTDFFLPNNNQIYLQWTAKKIHLSGYTYSCLYSDRWQYFYHENTLPGHNTDTQGQEKYTTYFSIVSLFFTNIL